MKQHLYDELAESIITSIENGLFVTGDKLPGVRRVCQDRGVSTATAVAAYGVLENRGYIEARQRSGFYVLPRSVSTLVEPQVSSPALRPNLVRGQDLVLRMMQSLHHPEVVQLGAAVPANDYLPIKLLRQILPQVSQQSSNVFASYELPGLPPLQQQLAKHMLLAGCHVKADDIVVTAGCQEAIYLTLKVLTKPGDIVALESPTFYGFLQIIESLGLRAIEIPTHPRDGISVDAIRLAAEQWNINVCLVMPTYSNPLGSCMSDSNKNALVSLAEEYDFHLIEDDIYGDFSYDHQRPKALKAFDSVDRVIYCSSFSKSISPGLRVGWVASRKFNQELIHQKFLLNCATSGVPQAALTKFLSSGRYSKHMRTMQRSMELSTKKMIEHIEKEFPADTKITQPVGGFVLWVELSKKIDTLALSNLLMEHNISIAPGKIFSATDKYNHCFRLSCGIVWSRRVEESIKTIGKLIGQIV